MSHRTEQSDVRLDAPVLQPIEFAADDPLSFRAYPYPQLKQTGAQSFDATLLTLESQFLSASFLPEFGGRLVALALKSLDGAVLEQTQTIHVTAGGPQGLEWVEGIEVVLASEGRPNLLGPVQWQVEERENGEAPCLLFRDHIAGKDLELQVRARLSDKGRTVLISVRVFNRGWLPTDCGCGLRVGLQGSRAIDACAFVSPQGERVWAIDGSEPADFSVEDDRVLFLMPQRLLMPHEVWESEFRVSVFSKLLGETSANTHIAISTFAEALHLETAADTGPLRLYVLTDDGQTLESTVSDAFSSPVAVYFAGPLDIRKARVVLESGEILIDKDFSEVRKIPALAPSPTRDATQRALEDPSAETPERSYTAALDALQNGRTEAGSWEHAEQSPTLRPAAVLGRAIQANEVGDAIQLVERALNFNAEDGIAWWLLAALRRRAGADPGEALLNAHFLSPLEPLLRAEAFLAMPVAEGRGPAEILAPLADEPDALIECSCRLIECGSMEDAARWIQAALDHSNLGTLRYLMAYCLGKATKMASEAEIWVRSARELPIGPPFPWREMEWAAIRWAHANFPDVRTTALMDLYADLNRVPASSS